MGNVERKKVLLVSNMLAPYRRLIYSGLLKQKKYEFKFYFYDRSGDTRWKIDKNVSSNISLVSVLSNYKPDILICGGYSIYSFLLLLYKRCFGKKMLIWSAETVDSEACRKNNRFLRKIFRIPMFRSVDAWLAYGPPASEYLANHGIAPEKIRIVNNPSELDWKDVGERAPVGNEVLSVIRMVEQKSPYSIIELAKLAAKKYPDLKFTVIGDGPLLPEFNKLICDNNLNNIKNIERVDRDVIHKYYRRSSLLLHIPRYDQWPHVINEAMINGLPIICTNKCGIPGDLVENEVNGFVVDEIDYFSLIEKIVYLVKNDSINKKFGYFSREKIKNINSFETVSNIINMLDWISDERCL